MDGYDGYVLQGGELFNVVHTRTRDGVPLAHARFYAAVVSCAFGYLGSKVLRSDRVVIES